MSRITRSQTAALEAAKRDKVRRKAPALIGIALAGALAVGGTVAFIMTTTGEVSNSFQPTEVACEVDEGSFKNGDSVKKEVSIENTGTTDAFIRAEIVVNWVKLDSEGKSVVSILGTAPVLGTDYELELESDTSWTQEMADGFYYFKESVVPSTALKKSFTDVLIKSCEPLKAAPVDGYVLRVDVIAEAVQADGTDAKGNRPVELAWGVDIADGQVKDATIAQ